MLNKWPLRIISLLSIGGGFFGISALLPFLLEITGFISLALNLLVSAFFCLGIYSGYKLIEENTKSAIILNMKFWSLQIPAIGAPIFIYQLSSGVMLSFIFNTEAGVNISFNIGSSFSYGLVDPSRPYIFGINIIAAFLVVYLIWIVSRKNMQT